MLLVLPYFLAATAGAAIMGIAVWARARAAQRAYGELRPGNPIPGHALPIQSLAELRRFRAVMDACEDPIYMVDRETLLFIDATAGALRQTGLRYDQLLKLGPQDLLMEKRENLIAKYDELISSAPEVVCPRARAL